MTTAENHWSAIEAADPEEIRDLQQSALQHQIASLISRSPFYRDKLAEVGAGAQDVTTLEDLSQLPFTEKQELRETQAESPPLGLYAGVDMAEVSRIHASSGTTGTPSYIGVTDRDSGLWAEAVARAYYCQGLRRDSVVTMGFGIGFFVGGLPVQQAIAKIGAAFIPVGPGATDRLIDASRDLGATVLTGTPSYVRYIADHLLARDIDPASIGFKNIIVGAEPGGGIPSFRRGLEGAWQAVVTECVGNGDVVPVHSSECEAQSGSHFLVPDMAILELIDPMTGDVKDLWSQPKMEGELVFTHIDRDCGALVRFRTRDHVEIRTDPCPCGRTGPRMVCVGRTDDMLLVRGVNVWPSAIKDIVAGFVPRVSGQFRIALDQDGHHHDPPLHLVVEVTDAETITEEEIEAELRAKLIVACSVEFIPEGTLFRTQAKENLIWQRNVEPDLSKAGV